MVIIGMLMDDVSGTLLVVLILLPIGMELGVNPYQMAAILGVNLGMGNRNPADRAVPLPGRAYLQGGTPSSMMKPMLTIIAFCYVPTLILTTYIREFSLWLLRLIMGSV